MIALEYMTNVNLNTVKYQKNKHSQLSSEVPHTRPSATTSESPPITSESQFESNIDDSSDDTLCISNILDQEIAFWNDATSYDRDNDDTPQATPEAVDRQMIYYYDVEEITSRLVSKAPYLIGKI